eukprot:COSAG02_NODE_5709_length_4104_cov_1.876654_3_plen_104_part_00
MRAPFAPRDFRTARYVMGRTTPLVGRRVAPAAQRGRGAGAQSVEWVGCSLHPPRTRRTHTPFNPACDATADTVNSCLLVGTSPIRITDKSKTGCVAGNGQSVE